MLSKMDIVVDKDTFEEIMENALIDMEETDFWISGDPCQPWHRHHMQECHWNRFLQPQ